MVGESFLETIITEIPSLELVLLSIYLSYEIVNYLPSSILCSLFPGNSLSDCNNICWTKTNIPLRRGAVTPSVILSRLWVIILSGTPWCLYEQLEFVDY